MIALVTYMGVHTSNHQGGEGKSYKSRILIDIKDDTPAKDIIEICKKSIKSLTKDKQYYKDENLRIRKIEIVQEMQGLTI